MTTISRPTFVRHEVVADLDGQKQSIGVHQVSGRSGGPTVVLAAGHRGHQWFAAQVLRSLLPILDADRLDGEVRVVPVVNPSAAMSRTNAVTDNSLSPDLGVAFGADGNSVGHQLASTLMTAVLADADYYIAVRGGQDAARWSSTVPAGQDTDAGVRSLQMAAAFGPRGVHLESGGESGSAGHVAATSNIPSIRVEVGGTGFGESVEERFLADSVQGLLQILRVVGTLEREPGSRRLMTFSSRVEVTAREAGFFEPVLGSDDLGRRRVGAGELVGRVWSPYTMEVVEELFSPMEGIIDLVSLARPIRPGTACVAVIDIGHPGSSWTDVEF